MERREAGGKQRVLVAPKGEGPEQLTSVCVCVCVQHWTEGKWECEREAGRVGPASPPRELLRRGENTTEQGSKPPHNQGPRQTKTATHSMDTSVSPVYRLVMPWSTLVEPDPFDVPLPAFLSIYLTHSPFLLFHSLCLDPLLHSAMSFPPPSLFPPSLPGVVLFSDIWTDKGESHLSAGLKLLSALSLWYTALCHHCLGV